VRAIFEAAAELTSEGKKAIPEIMIPVTCNEKELEHQAALVKKVHDEVAAKFKVKKIPYL
jgi:pyruvate,orthophosphate dikinase